MSIRQLSPALINRIAAGEVIERPASVVKELVENAIDADAQSIEIVTVNGGLSLIRVTDDGIGMGAEDIALCIERHATSKLQDDDLLRIGSLGFRGEALPSIGSVAKLRIASRLRTGGQGLEIEVNGGEKQPARPAALNSGTRVEVRDLFYATPARLKFMKSEPAENAATNQIVKRIALAFPRIALSLTTGERASLNFPAVLPGDEDGLRMRLAKVMGKEFAAEAVPMRFERGGVSLTGFAGLPTLNRPTQQMQYFYINGRPVRDKLLLAALRAGYGDFVPRGRHPMAVLFVSLPAEEVDVNVHPAKAEVRFRDAGLVRGAVVAAIRQALEAGGLRTTSALHAAVVPAGTSPSPPAARASSFNAGRFDFSGSTPRKGFAEDWQSPFPVSPGPEAPENAEIEPPPQDSSIGELPLGSARAQLHETYIIAETGDAVIFVDQHAAHERLVYEKLKSAMAEGTIERQLLLIPEVVELDAEQAAMIASHGGEAERFGLVVEPFGETAILVREVPALLAKADIKALLRDFAEELQTLGSSERLEERLHNILSRIACHGSVRAGRRLKPQEMDSLLREMEATPAAGQCNHGRPTFVKIRLAELERMFSRR